MKAEEFCYWLRGYFELSDERELYKHQVDTIKSHLNLVFLHDIDPKAGGKEVQDALNEIHDDGQVTSLTYGDPPIDSVTSGLDPHWSPGGPKIRC